jgi:hypothetical protein
LDQFECALENLNVVKGVSCGIVTTADVEAVAAKIGIETSSMSDLYAFLREHGIRVCSADDEAHIWEDKKVEQKPNPRIKQFERADEGLEQLLKKEDMDSNHRQAWIRLVEQNETLMAVFVLKEQGYTASEIAGELDIPIDEVYRREYCICQRLRTVRRSHFHTRAKKIRDFYV